MVGVWKATAGRDGDPYDHGTSSKRQAWLAERQREEQEPGPATVGKLSPDASTRERQEWVVARMNGAEIDESASPEAVEEAA